MEIDRRRDQRFERIVGQQAKRRGKAATMAPARPVRGGDLADLARQKPQAPAVERLPERRRDLRDLALDRIERRNELRNLLSDRLRGREDLRDLIKDRLDRRAALRELIADRLGNREDLGEEEYAEGPITNREDLRDLIMDRVQSEGGLSQALNRLRDRVGENQR